MDIPAVNIWSANAMEHDMQRNAILPIFNGGNQMTQRNAKETDVIRR